MTISSVSNSHAAQQAYSVRNSYSPHRTVQADETVSVSKASSVSSRNDYPDTIDFTNMTESQFSSLVGSGKITGGHMLLMTLPQGMGGSSSQTAYVDENTSFNYIKKYADTINYDKSIGMDTSGLQDVLNQMEALQGEKYPAQSKIDSRA